MIPPLTIIPAGAGSGKTYTIQKKLAQWIKEGKVAPDRIVAVTFTEAAASELRDRIRTELVREGRLDDALKLDQAYISTIHSFGLRILTEFAFDAGISPIPRLLIEDEEKILIRRALAVTDRADLVMDNLMAHGYRFDYNSQEGPEDQFRGKILNLINKLRSIGVLEEDKQITSHALAKIKEVYGPTRSTLDLKEELLGAVNTLFEHFPDSMASSFPGNQSATNKLKADYWNLKKAEAGDALDYDWQLWNALRSLWVSNSRYKVPDGYDDLASAVMEAANNIVHHPGPLADALSHAEALLGGSQDCLNQYEADKKERGLVDYTDMLAVAHTLLTQRPDVLAGLKSRIDCLVVDEFQDTNPLQFSLLWELQKTGVPTLIVGDLKQAIMGFQNADSRLLDQLQTKFKETTSPLTENWRSTPRLMDWVNRVGEGLFKDGYTRLKPRADFPSRLEPLEVIDFQGFKRNNKAPAQHTVSRIKALLDDNTQTVYDKKLKIQRPLRPGDVAIVCRTNARVGDYAVALQNAGIRARIEEDGWFGSRIIQITYHALSYVADPSDGHAALYLAVTELGQYGLEGSISAIMNGDDLKDPILEELRKVADGAADRTVDTLVRDVINALDLFGRISSWPDASQARANLLRLQGEAESFMSTNREALSAGGYYGSGMQTFLSWLRKKAEDEDSQPQPRVVEEDAVQVMTWHKSKGREWPVVAVCAFDSEVSARLPSFDISFEDFSDLSALLEKARIEISPEFAIPEKNDSFLAPLQQKEEQEALRLLYVALTRAREKLILEWPSYKDGGSRLTYWDVLRSSTALELRDNRLLIGGDEFECHVTVATPNTQGTGEGHEPVFKLPTIGRRAIEEAQLPVDLTPETLSPSSLHGEVEIKGELIKESYAGPLDPCLDMSAVERGTLLHRCFEVTNGDREKLGLISSSLGYILTDEQLGRIGKAISDFNMWLTKKFSPIAVSSEVPILALNEQSSVVSGVIDLLVETDEGFWIIDHKSDETEDLEERFRFYLPQLHCYADAVGKARAGKPVIGVMINWIIFGRVCVYLKSR